MTNTEKALTQVVGFGCEEAINRMRLCTICRDNDEWPYTAIAAQLHDRDGLHSTFGNAWAPMKGHAMYEQHMRQRELLTT